LNTFARYWRVIGALSSVTFGYVADLPRNRPWNEPGRLRVDDHMPSTDHPDHSDQRIEDNPKWIRGFVDGRLVVDSRSTKFVWEVPWYPTWYIPVGDVLDSALSTTTIPELPAHVHLDWAAVDRWFEEDVEVFVHPRSPYTRVDILRSSRHVVVRIDGTVVADTVKPTILVETGLPPRWYIPPTDVRLGLLTQSEKTTGCPYKGFATYWGVDLDGILHPDIAWSYATPLPESTGVAGLVCFYDEMVDIEIDGASSGGHAG